MILTNINRATLRTERKLTRRCLTSTKDFHELETAWGELFEESPHAAIFNSWEWLFSWWQAYGDKKKLRLLIWRNDEKTEIIGVAPLYLTTEEIAPGIKCKVLRLLGDGSLDSDYLDFIVWPAHFNAVVADFGEWLAANHEWEVLVLNTIPPESGLPKALYSIAQKWNLLYRGDDQPCGDTPLPNSFERFLSERQPRFRTRLRALLRKFDLDDHLVFDNGSADLEKRLASLYRLHHLRWREKGRAGVFEDKTKRAFYEYFVPRFGRKGWLRFYSLRNEPTYLAHQLCFGRNGRTYLLQEGFDISDKSAGYGQMLRALVFRFLIERGEKVYAFLGGFSNHKADWGAIPAAMKSVIIARKNLRGKIYFEKPLWRAKAAAHVKRWVPEPIWKILRPG